MESSNPFTKKGSDLFFQGGSITDNDFKYKPEYAPKEQRVKVNRYIRFILGTWDSKHEHKEAMVGYALSNVLDYSGK